MADDALECALRVLRHRDRSLDEVERHLQARGFSEHERAQAIATLQRTGLVDDSRYAEARAASLAARGAGNELIRYELAEAGVSSELVEEALERLEPEVTRARRIVVSRGGGRKTARYLSGKGFANAVVRAAVAEESEDELG